MSETSNTKPETAETETRRLRVYRFKRGDGGEHFDGFDVPVGPRTTLLDALRRIQRNRDPSLALRHSCMHAPVVRHLRRAGRRPRGAGVRLLAPGPRRGDHGRAAGQHPGPHDLVVDMEDFFERFPGEHPIIRTSEVCPRRSHRTRWRRTSASRTASSATCAFRPARWPRRRGSTPGRLPWHRLSGCSRSSRGRLRRRLDLGRQPRRCLAHVGLECSRACPADAIPAERSWCCAAS